jgi:hypothetical protein
MHENKTEIEVPEIPETKVIKLRKKIVLGELEVSELLLREPLAGELDRAQSSASTAIGHAILLIAIVAGIPRQIAEKIPQRELMRANSYLNLFTEDGPTTGNAE